MAAGDYGDELSIEHEPFTPYETYTVSLSSGITYTGTEVVLPASFDFTAQPVTLTQITIAGASIGAPGTYTFTTSGPHTVEIGVWSCDVSAAEAVTATLGLTTYPRPIYLPLVMRNF